MLQKIEHLSTLLQKAADDAINSGESLDLDKFLNTIVHLIRDQLGFYYVGWVLKNRKARIALDVGDEAVIFYSPGYPF